MLILLCSDAKYCKDKMKRAQGENFIRYAILALISLFILLFIFGGILNYISRLSPEIKCRYSVWLASIIKTPIIKHRGGGIICPTRNILITTAGKNKDKKDNINDQLLREMYICAKRFYFKNGRAYKNPFSEWKTDKVCVICANITFDAKVKEEYPLLDGLMERATRVKVEDKTYYEYFTGEVPNENVKELFHKAKAINTSLRYVVVYQIGMTTTKENFFKWLGVGATAGAVITTPLVTIPAIIIASIPGVSISVGAVAGYGFISGALLGSAPGGYIGTMHRDEYSGAVLLLPIDAIRGYCSSLGQNPFRNPFKEEKSSNYIFDG